MRCLTVRGDSLAVVSSSYRRFYLCKLPLRLSELSAIERSLWRQYLVGFPFDVNVGVDDGEGRIGVLTEVDLLRQVADWIQRRVLGCGVPQRQVIETQATPLLNFHNQINRFNYNGHKHSINCSFHIHTETRRVNLTMEPNARNLSMTINQAVRCGKNNNME